MSAQDTRLVLREVQQLTDTVISPVFEREDGAPLKWHAGQFFMFHMEDEAGTFSRSYSIATPPTPDAPRFAFCISRVEDGRGSDIVFRLTPGVSVHATGPFGRFVLRPGETPERLLLLATGTGIAPYRAMLPALEERALAGTAVHVILGVRRRTDGLYVDDFRAAAGRCPGLHFTLCCSRETEGFEAGEQAGYVQTALADLDPDSVRDLVYLCGNPAMVDEVVESLSARGFGPRQIRREKYISPTT